jgi:hypothetical protein
MVLAGMTSDRKAVQVVDGEEDEARDARTIDSGLLNPPLKSFRKGTRRSGGAENPREKPGKWHRNTSETRAVPVPEGAHA